YRSDQFSFGLILYEMLTGRIAFKKDSKGETLAAILRDEPPPIAESNRAVPAPLVWIVERCLAKDPEKRFVSTRDLARDLSAIREHLSEAVSTRAEVLDGKPRSPWFRPLAILAAVLLLGLVFGLVAIIVRTGSHAAPAAGPIRFSVPPPANGAFYYGVEVSFLAISPDGSQLAYVASDSQGGQRIFLRPVSASDARPLPGTEGANSLFFSPDGRSIAFFAGGKLKRVEISGGAAVSICDVPLVGPNWSGTWGRGGDILYAGVTRGWGVFRVSASGGVPAEVIPVDPSRGEARIGWPSFLPDGERFLYQVRHLDGHGDLMLAEPGKKPRLVMPMQSAVQYVDPGYLVFAKEGVLLARSFDLASGRVTGEPFSIAEHVRYFLSTGAASFAASRTGTIVYQSQDNVRRLTWFDRTGRELGFVGPPGNYISISMSPDGRRALSDPTRPGIGTYGVWLFDLERGTETPVTPGPETEVYPIWLPGGGAFAYTADRGNAPQLFRRDLATGKEERLVPSAGFFQWPQDVSPDGRSLVYCQASEHAWYDVWTLPLAGGNPVAFLRAPFDKRVVRFSPDGRYVAMITTESGQPEVYVTAYPGPGERIRVSTGGAYGLRWSREGRELLYVSGDRRLMSISVRTAPTLELGKPAALFALTGPDWISFDVSPDGKRFLAVVPKVVADELPLNVIVNWPSAVGK
ncbi:MAG TPA: hypothetical protein VE007_10555, partial [Thermoanaerobaculia bacterium]|nr:hypothetical protein [Thermoanaerobaculia bacterium]